MNKIILLSGVALLAHAVHANDRQTRMMDIEYVDDQQCIVAIDNTILSIMPMLALAWLEAQDVDSRTRARDAFHTALKRHCDINAPDLGGLNALNLAILANNADITLELLTHGADPNRRIESRDPLFHDKTSHTLLDTLEQLDPQTDRTRIRNALATRTTTK